MTGTSNIHDSTQLLLPAEPRSGGAASSEPQWRLESLQMVNWGGFEGHHTVIYHPGSTLVSGESGTGKSTMLDAYTALMMPSDVPFNGASNDAGTGRARDESKGRRTLLTYLRGKVANTDEGGGGKSVTLLRGKGHATWGAVAATFVNSDGEAFTAARVYHVPANATDLGGIARHLLTYEGRLDLAVVDPVMTQFVPSSQKLGTILPSAVPGLKPHRTYNSFSTALFTKLAIGTNGDGEKALQLLARIQASKTVHSVNQLYRDLVLDTPATFADADRAIAHFDHLEDSYRQMETAASKADVLHEIPQVHDRLTLARRDAQELDTFGATCHDVTTPLTVWALRTEDRLLDTAITEVQGAKRRNAEAYKAAVAAVSHLKAELKDASAQYHSEGGAELDSIDGQIQSAEIARDGKETNRALLARLADAANPGLDTQTDFRLLREAAEAFLTEQGSWQAKHDHTRNEVLRRQIGLLDRKRTVEDELRSLSSRKGRIPKLLDDLRADVAQASGIPAEELPFLAELIDVADGEDKWRLAIETVLRGDARRLLVPADRFSAFSTAIDRLRLRGRITFVAAKLNLELRLGLDGAEDAEQRRHVAGKLVYADHPYAGWIQQRLTRPGRNALCVDTATGLDGDGFRVTLAGQTRHGPEGAHGRTETTYVIGFSNASLIEDYAAELTHIQTDLTAIATELSKLGKVAEQRRDLHAAYVAVGQYTWDQIDVAGAQALVTDLQQRRQRVKDANSKLAELDELIDQLNKAHDDAVGERKILAEKKTNLEDQHAELVDRQDQIRSDLDTIDAEQRVVLTEDQAARLDTEFKQAVDPGDPDNLDDFEKNLGRLNKQLREAADRAQAEAQRSEAELVKVFSQYQEKWDDPNLGTDVTSYSDYKRILDEIEATGLYKRKQEWQRQLTEWSGEDLVPLATSVRKAVDDIDDRIGPINDILADLPFGAHGGHLHVKVERVTTVPVRQFLTRLKRLSSTATTDMAFDQMVRRFKELREFMDLLRDPDDQKYDRERSDRQRLLDVRRHVQISALEIPPTPGMWETREYQMLGETAGGETQELVAFIIGSALRFRLGDQFRTLPRFAPMFLDEGFVKADAKFAGRAIQAWKGLGFQIIVSTPENNVTGLERHMDEFVAITKDPSTKYSYIHPVKDAASPHGTRQDAAP